MSNLKVYNMEGAEVGDLSVAAERLVLDKGEQAVHDVVVALQAGRRAGTASTLRKGEVAGSGAKPWRQKGTGRARAGYRQSPVWRGGGVAFGPHPRDYSKKVNRKVGRLAFQRALSEKVASGEIRVLEEMTVAEGRTREFAALLKALDVKPPLLLVLGAADKKVTQAARNVPRVEVTAVESVNVFQLVRYPLVLVDKAGMEELLKKLDGEKSA